jgi:hypothetical protein
MEISLIIALLAIGATMGGLVVAAWYSDYAPPPSGDQSEHGANPL